MSSCNLTLSLPSGLRSDRLRRTRHRADRSGLRVEARRASSRQKNRFKDVVVSPSVVLAHGYRTDGGHDHEGAVSDALRIECVSVHEGMDEEGDFAELLPSPELSTNGPELAEEEHAASGEPVGIAEDTR